MPSIGPSLPPLSKRSHEDADGYSEPDDSSEKRRRVVGPAPPPAAAFSSKRSIGPSMPPGAGRDSGSPESGPAPPPARVFGAAPPPAPLDEKPLASADDDSDSSDDDFGPAPPPVGVQASSFDGAVTGKSVSAFDTDPQFTEPTKSTQRDEWMTLPPTQDDLAARMDPTKQRARKFNSGKSAGSAGGMSSAWTETPEQKLKRLQDEAMGISTPAQSGGGADVRTHKSKEEERRERKMREKIESSRGKSLVEQHKEKGTGKEKEDDPSKRAFDYEKDMAVSGSVNHKQRREMLSKSKGFGDRFSSGSFL